MSDRDRYRGRAPRDPAEGVRLIGGDEAAEALERGEAHGRLSRGQPRFGDRPPAPAPDESRRTLRFPLASSDDPATFERPVPAPVPPRDEAPELSHWAGSARDQVPNMGPRDARDGGAGRPPPAQHEPRWQEDYEGPPEDPGGPSWPPPSGQPLEGTPVAFEEVQEPPPGPSVFGAAPRGPGVEADGWGGQDPRSPDEADDGYDDYDDDYRYDEYGYDDYELDEGEPALAGPPTGRGAGLRGGGRGRRGADRNLRTALVVGLVFGAVAIALLRFGGPLGGMLLVLPVVGYGTYEYLTAAHRAGFQPLLPVGVAASVGLPLAAYNYGEAAIPLALTLTVVVGFLWYLVRAGGDRPVANLGATVLGVLWIGGLGAFAALLLSAPNGVSLLLAALLPTIAYDVGGLFVGRSAGSRSLSSVSPNKTVEGLAGGMILALVVGIVYAMIGVAPFDGFADGVVIGLVVALAAPLGDLTESLVKRDLDVKDMGQILPGHGGLLDRFDALLFVLPAMWYVSRLSDFFLG